MKRINFFAMMILGLLFSTMSFANNRHVAVDELPITVRSFVQENFRGKAIVNAEKDFNSYECRLSNGTKVAFYRRGEWKKIDTNDMTAVPSALIPDAVKQYVKGTFPGAIITKIEKESYGYDIELSNYLKVKLTHQGTLLRMNK